MCFFRTVCRCLCICIAFVHMMIMAKWFRDRSGIIYVESIQCTGK